MKAYFQCDKCSRKQRLDVGVVTVINEKPDYQIRFENEVKCKFCGSYDIKISDDSRLQILLGAPLRMLDKNSAGDEDVRFVDPEIFVENIRMHHTKVMEHFAKRFAEEPDNAELHLRYANSLRSINRCPEAIEHYKKALELNPKLIAVLINLCHIFGHRYKQFADKEAKHTVKDYWEKLSALYENGDYDTATIPKGASIDREIREIYLEYFSKAEKFVMNEHTFFSLMKFDKIPGFSLNERNFQQYDTLLYAVESAIAFYYRSEPGLRDIDVMNSLRRIRDNLPMEGAVNDLDRNILYRLKFAMHKLRRQKKYAIDEIRAVVNYILRSVKNHHYKGSKGYLEFIAKELGETSHVVFYGPGDNVFLSLEQNWFTNDA